ncbi:MAG: hypothetical protein M0021_01025 [Clostridia bacterium]|nr:hypothetical protein [Clostridia bacterium]
MEVRKIFKAGNSHVVALPQEILKELGLQDGSQVVVSVNKGSKEVVLKPLTLYPETKIEPGFAELVEEFITDYEVALKELAK